MSRQFTIVPVGEFDLVEAGRFGFGQRLAPVWDGVLRLAFCLDGYREQVGVEVRQDADGRILCTAYGSPDLMAIRRQVARCLSLDHDGTAFREIGRRDPIIGRLQAAAPGLRPPLFYSPYEAAVWAVLALRRPARLMAEVRRRLSEAHGTVFELAGQETHALPTPEQLLGVSAFPGISPQKLDWLHGIARAAQDGRLDADRLQSLGPAAAMAELRTIKGIGAFYSSLIVVRATGLTDVLPAKEPRLLELVTDLYRLGQAPSEAEFRTLAEPWRPYRTWASVLIRAAAGRISPADAA